MEHRYHVTPLSALLFLVIMSAPASAESPRGKLLLAPFLQAATDTSIAVLVETRPGARVTVEYATTGFESLIAHATRTDTTDEGTVVHLVHLRGLEPGTTYDYRVFVDSLPTPVRSFSTAVCRNVPVRFAWMADTRANPAVHDSIAERVGSEDPAFLLFGGDMGPTPKYASFKEFFFRPPMMDMIASIPFFNATGNHEKWSRNTKAFTESPPSDSLSEGYYSFDYGELHVALMNNEVDYSPGSPQYEFLKNDLASTRRPWKIVASHRPAYCAGGHGEDRNMIRLTTDIFEPNGVQVVLSGHSHFFQHNIVNGIHHLVVGSAGAPLYNPERAPYTVTALKEYNYAIGEVRQNQLTIVIRNQRGDLLDTVTLRRKVCGCPGE